MKRRRSVVKIVKQVKGDDFVEQIVTGFYGGKATKIVKRVEIGRLHRIGQLTADAVDAGYEEPTCDVIYIEPEDWSRHYLRRI